MSKMSGLNGFYVLAVHDCFKHAAGHDIFLLDWRQVLSYDVSLLNIRFIVNSVIDLVQLTKIDLLSQITILPTKMSHFHR
jgi:hypothetical protein